MITFSDQRQKSTRAAGKFPAAFLYQSGVLRGILSLVNRRFPCNIRDDFSGVPAIKKIFMDRLHLLDFLGKGLCRFPVKMLQRQYHVSIMFLSRLYQNFLQSMTFFRMGKGEKCRRWEVLRRQK